jgi:hypothetical protein
MKKISILFMLIAAACTEQPEIIPYDYTQVFTGESRKGWSIRSFQYTEEGKATQTGQLEECLSDDIYIFYANEERRAEVLEGSSKCSPEDPDLIAEGSWSFVNTNATLTMPFPLFADFPLPFVVRDVQDDRMTLEIFFTDGKSSYRFNFRVAELE